VVGGVHHFDFFMLPFLDRVGNEARLFMGIRVMEVLFLEMLEGIMDGFGLGGGVSVGHEDGLSNFQIEKALDDQGLFIKRRGQTTARSLRQPGT
jgi:hypothetical protein